MKKEKKQPTWQEANQAFLSAEFARLKHMLGSKAGGDAEELVKKARVVMDPPATIDRLAGLLSLSPFETDLLLLCAGVEMDSDLAVKCAEASSNAHRPYVTFGLALASLPHPHWSALTPGGPLRRFKLVELEEGQGLTTAPLRIDERILHYLAGVNALDFRVQSFLYPALEPHWIAEEHQVLAAKATKILQSYPAHEGPVLHFCGDDSQGQEDAAAWSAKASGTWLCVLRSENLPSPGPDLELFLALWGRETLLMSGALLIQCESGGITPSVRHLLENLPGPVYLASHEPVRLGRPFLRFDLDKPQPVGQRQLWERALGSPSKKLKGTLDDLSSQFRLSAKTIFSIVALADREKAGPQDLWEACRSFSRPRLDDLAQRIELCSGWDDLILPPAQKQILRQLALQARHRMKVYESWGFSAKGRRGLGVSALFTGESGTGKTMAAEVLARELGLDLYRIDLSAVVSKYIGETEKNLRQVFDTAEEGGVILLFDEADALFGKRGDVKDSHDRYANIEVGYLLQRIETYRGLAILTTNLKSSMDRAFQRRLRFTVNFPFPDAAQREAIWSRVFPSQTPTKDLQPGKLAQLNLAGGNIRNIALNAAFLAVEEDKPVEMSHLLRASQLEAQKTERPLSSAETRGWE